MASLELDKILERAVKRTKKKWWKAALTMLLGWGLFFILGSLGFVLAVLVFFLFKAVFSTVVGVIFGIVILILAVALANAWANLAYAKVVIENKDIGPFKSFSDTKSLVKGYLIFTLLYFFFMLGLLPYLAIPFILWSIWGVFYLYVFLIEPEARGGLKPLWRSRELVKGNVWKVFFVVLLFFGIGVLSAILSIYSEVISAVWFVFSTFFLSPFSVAVYWEMYKDLVSQKKEVKAPRPAASVALSIVGLLIMVGLFTAMASSMSRAVREMNLKQFIQEVNRKEKMRKYPYKYNQKLPSTYDSSYDFYDGEF